MRSALEGAGVVTDALSLPLHHRPLAPAEVRAGSPTTGLRELGTIGGAEVGIWEMSPGRAVDTETDEVVVVLAGSARIEFIDPVLPPIEVRAGSVVRLVEGMRTEWTVHETLRKVYIA